MTDFEEDGKTVARTVSAKGVEINYSKFRPIWQTQRKVADAEVSKVEANGYSIGDPNSPFNQHVDKRYAAAAKTSDRQRPVSANGMPVSSTRATAQAKNKNSSSKTAYRGITR